MDYEEDGEDDGEEDGEEDYEEEYEEDYELEDEEPEPVADYVIQEGSELEDDTEYTLADAEVVPKPPVPLLVQERIESAAPPVAPPPPKPKPKPVQETPAPVPQQAPLPREQMFTWESPEMWWEETTDGPRWNDASIDKNQDNNGEAA